MLTSGLRRYEDEDVHYADRTSGKLLAGPRIDCRDVRPPKQGLGFRALELLDYPQNPNSVVR